MEMRRDKRIDIQAKGFFLLDGVASHIKVKDTNLRGIGAYAANELKPGQQGVLIARLPNFPEGEGLTSEVCWCLADPMAEDASYPYRVGLRII